MVVERKIWNPGPELGKHLVEVKGVASSNSIIGVHSNEEAYYVKIVKTIEPTRVRDYEEGSVRIAFLGELSEEN